MADVVFYPDAHPEDTSVDGWANRSGVIETWADIHGSAGTESSDTSDGASASIASYSTTDRYNSLGRPIILFDTSGIVADVTAAILRLYIDDKTRTAGWGALNPTFGIYASTPASNTAIVPADYGQLAATLLSDSIAYNDITENAWLTFTLNAAGLAAIVDGITKLAFRISYDALNSAPPWATNSQISIAFQCADNASDNRPELVITYDPIVTTQAVTNIVTTTATGNGNIIDLGGPTATQHGHCWNTTGTPTTSDSKTENGVPSATGAFTSALTGLTAGMKYYVRAYIINTEGTEYGNQVEFTADRGTVFPTDPLLRVSGLRRTFWSGLGGRAVYQMELALGGMSITYVSPIGSRDIPSAVTPLTTAAKMFTPSGEGHPLRDYGTWLSGTTVDIQIKLFGHSPPLVNEWLDWRKAVLEQGYAEWSY